MRLTEVGSPQFWGRASEPENKRRVRVVPLPFSDSVRHRNVVLEEYKHKRWSVISTLACRVTRTEALELAKRARGRL